MTTAKLPTTQPALADFGGEFPDAAAPTELTLDGAITDSGTAILCNETIPTEYPASGWIRIDDEVIHYSSFTAKTFTADVRGDQTEYGAGAAAAHDDNATVGLWVSAQTINQLIQETIQMSKTGAGAKGADVASAGALNIGEDGHYFHVTGTTAITSIETRLAGQVIVLEFDGALTLTHHATDLILRGGANVTTAAGDIFIFVSEGSGDWREIARCTTSSIGGTSTRRLFIPAPAFGSLFGAPALQANPSAGTANTIGWFLDAASTEGVGSLFMVPKEWVSGTMTLIVHYFMESATSGNVRIRSRARAMADGESVDAAYDVNVTDSVAVPGTAEMTDRHTVSATLTVAADDLVEIDIARMGTDGADTATGDMALVGVEVQFTAS